MAPSPPRQAVAGTTSRCIDAPRPPARCAMHATMPPSSPDFQHHLHWAWCGDQLVSLDPANDCYAVHPPDTSQLLAAEAARRCAPLPAPLFPRGIPAHDWRLAPEDLAPYRLRWLPRALATLHRVHRRTRRHRIAGLLQLLASPDPTARGARSHADTDTVCSAVVATLNVACLLHPATIRCLEWSGACVLLGRQLGLRPRLVIGVCNRPFAAHAWVECNGQVIGDDPRRRLQLAVIFTTPPDPARP